MTAIDQAKQLYARLGLDLSRDLGWHLDYGVVFCTPDRLVLAHAIRLAEPAVWPATAPDAWYVRLALGRGSLAWFVRQMPHFLPSLAWRRGFRGDERLRVYDTARFIRKLPHHEQHQG